MRCDFFGATVNESLESLETVFSQFVVILVTVLHDERHHPFYLLSESVSGLATGILKTSYQIVSESAINHDDLYGPDGSDTLYVRPDNVFNFLCGQSVQKVVEEFIVQVIVARCDEMT